MRNREKDSINWLMNQEDARALIQVINPRDFTIIEAVTLHVGAVDQEEVISETSEMVQWKREEAEQKLRIWINKVNDIHGHKVGEKYIYFRFKKWN